MTPNRRFLVFLAILFICAIITLIIAPAPIAQDPRYHDFADQRSWLAVPNFANVASNIMFLLPGLGGLAALRRMRSGLAPKEPLSPIVTLCVGAILTAAGSAIYHWSPSDRSLVLDRLGMVVAFAAFIAILMSHFDVPHALPALAVLLAAGVGTVLVWVYFEDLRSYGAFQAFPVVLFAVGSFLFPRRHTRHALLWIVIIGYVLAKVFESLDHQIYDAAGIVSGHTLKHLVAGASLWITVVWLRIRQPIL
jgi:hypothetical protein